MSTLNKQQFNITYKIIPIPKFVGFFFLLLIVASQTLPNNKSDLIQVNIQTKCYKPE